MKKPVSSKVAFAALVLSAQAATAETVNVAVAANFVSAFEAIVTAFETQTEYTVRILSGSTGQLYAQISRGAPVDVFLAADAARPQLLIDDGLADAASRFTYARGRLALWSRVIDDVDTQGLSALNGDYRHLAIANPELAPYGKAARQVLESLDAWGGARQRLVYGQSIGQAFAMVATQTAELGFVALSQVLSFEDGGGFVAIPTGLHDPIVQDAVLLKPAARKPAARALVAFLRSPAAIQIIRSKGYDADP